jgi:hypothetical protein
MMGLPAFYHAGGGKVKRRRTLMRHHEYESHRVDRLND